MEPFDQWAAKARAVPIEHEIERRAIHLTGKIDRCGPCPKCGGADRFAINIKKQVWNCRGCNTGGDVIKLVEHLDGVDFIGACAILTGELPPKPNGTAGSAEHKIVAAEYPYENEDGATVFAVERVEFIKSTGGHVLGRQTQEDVPAEAARPGTPRLLDPEC
jgi:phage/plasmid primase-like uncharacterized protein